MVEYQRLALAVVEQQCFGLPEHWYFEMMVEGQRLQRFIWKTYQGSLPV